MIPPGSRYEVAEHNMTFSHLYSERGYPLLGGEEGRTSLRVRTALRDTLYRVTTEQEPVGTTVGYYAKELENFQFLGFKILDDPKRWTELAEMNPQIWYPLDIKPGAFLRIPVTMTMTSIDPNAGGSAARNTRGRVPVFSPRLNESRSMSPR